MSSTKKRKADATSDDRRPSKKAKKAAKAKSNPWAGIALGDVRVTVYDNKDGEYPLDDVDYTDGGKSSQFGGKGIVTVDESKRSITIDTCLAMRPKTRYNISMDTVDGDEFDCAADVKIPQIDGTGMAVLKVTTKFGVIVDLGFWRWNEEDQDVRLTRCELTLPESVPFLAAHDRLMQQLTEEFDPADCGADEKTKLAMEAIHARMKKLKDDRAQCGRADCGPDCTHESKRSLDQLLENPMEEFDPSELWTEAVTKKPKSEKTLADFLEEIGAVAVPLDITRSGKYVEVKTDKKETKTPQNSPAKTASGGKEEKKADAAKDKPKMIEIELPHNFDDPGYCMPPMPFSMEKSAAIMRICQGVALKYQCPCGKGWFKVQDDYSKNYPFRDPAPTPNIGTPKLFKGIGIPMPATFRAWCTKAAECGHAALFTDQKRSEYPSKEFKAYWAKLETPAAKPNATSSKKGTDEYDDDWDRCPVCKEVGDDCPCSDEDEAPAKKPKASDKEEKKKAATFDKCAVCKDLLYCECASDSDGDELEQKLEDSEAEERARKLKAKPLVHREHGFEKLTAKDMPDYLKKPVDALASMCWLISKACKRQQCTCGRTGKIEGTRNTLLDVDPATTKMYAGGLVELPSVFEAECSKCDQIFTFSEAAPKAEEKKKSTDAPTIEEEFRKFWPEMVSDLADITDLDVRQMTMLQFMVKGGLFRPPTHKQQRSGAIVRV